MSHSSRLLLVWTKVILFAVISCSTGGLRAQGRSEPVACSGTVVDWRGHPVAGVEVMGRENLYDYAAGRTSWGPLARTTTGPHGRFQLDVIAERQDYIYVVAWKKGLALGWQSPRFARSCQDMVVRLGKPDVLAGLVVDEAGRGITGATVCLCLKMSWMGGTPGVEFDTPREWFSTRTDDHGGFRFEHIPAGGTADLWAEAPGKASCWTYWGSRGSSVAGSRFQAGQIDIRIALKPEGVIRGKVVDEDSGQGVAGVRLLARLNERYANYGSVPPVTSGPDGTFIYSGLAANDYSLQVVAPYRQAADWVGKDTKVSVKAGQTIEVEVPVGEGGILEVTVLDARTEKPVENAGVNISLAASFGLHPCWYHAAFTNVDGLARLRSPVGKVRLNIWGHAYDYLTHPDPPVIAKGEVVTREAVLTPFPTVTGTVRDPNGQPASDVTVSSKPICEKDVKTDAEGRYEVRWRPHDSVRDVKILARDPERNLAGLAKVKDQDQPVDVVLSPAYGLRGRVTDPNGKPIPLATISLWASMPRWRTNGAPDVFTDADGLYEISAVAAPTEGFAYRMRISAEGFGPVERRDLPFDAAETRQVEVEPLILMPADKSVSGVVVDANGAPAPGVPIFITGPRGSRTAGQPERQTSSDDQGRFAVHGVCAGPLRIQADFGEEAGFLDAKGGDSDVEVVLGREGVHTGLKSLLGKPLPDWGDLIDLDAEQTKGKALLFCFFDFQQRPSRNAIVQLAKQADALKQKGLVTVAVQACEVDDDALSEWIEQRDVTLPVGRIRTDVAATRLAWGIKSLPWLILANERHVVTAEEFAVAEVEDQLVTIGESR